MDDDTSSNYSLPNTPEDSFYEEIVLASKDSFFLSQRSKIIKINANADTEPLSLLTRHPRSLWSLASLQDGHEPFVWALFDSHEHALLALETLCSPIAEPALESDLHPYAKLKKVDIKTWCSQLTPIPSHVFPLQDSTTTTTTTEMNATCRTHHIDVDGGVTQTSLESGKLERETNLKGSPPESPEVILPMVNPHAASRERNINQLGVQNQLQTVNVGLPSFLPPPPHSIRNQPNTATKGDQPLVNDMPADPFVPYAIDSRQTAENPFDHDRLGTRLCGFSPLTFSLGGLGERPHLASLGSIHDQSTTVQKTQSPKVMRESPTMSYPTNTFRTGDWICSIPACGTHNFGRNVTCIVCGTSKLHAAMGMGMGRDEPSTYIPMGRDEPSTYIPVVPRPQRDLASNNVLVQAFGGIGQVAAIQQAIKAHQSQNQKYTRREIPFNNQLLIPTTLGNSPPRPPSRGPIVVQNRTRLPQAAPSPFTPAPAPAAASLSCKIPPLLTPSGRRFAAGGRVQNISRDELNPILMFWPDNEPLPLSSQVRPPTAILMALGGVQGPPPPILNTGNKGPIDAQPGDWTCGKCDYLNWRRRRVCANCFPHAEGNTEGTKHSTNDVQERVALLATVLVQQQQQQQQSAFGQNPFPRQYVEPRRHDSMPSNLDQVPLHLLARRYAYAVPPAGLRQNIVEQQQLAPPLNLPPRMIHPSASDGMLSRNLMEASSFHMDKHAVIDKQPFQPFRTNDTIFPHQRRQSPPSSRSSLSMGSHGSLYHHHHHQEPTPTPYPLLPAFLQEVVGDASESSSSSVHESPSPPSPASQSSAYGSTFYGRRDHQQQRSLPTGPPVSNNIHRTTSHSSIWSLGYPGDRKEDGIRHHV